MQQGWWLSLRTTAATAKQLATRYMPVGGLPLHVRRPGPALPRPRLTCRKLKMALCQVVALRQWTMQMLLVRQLHCMPLCDSAH